MRLTHIKLSGFKSFVDPTTISVPGQLVAVIGPNGCGKSNVIDAVRWVLGEASAKQLRGESMQDVIFNGAATRRPAPRAAVELVFNNAEGTLQGPWGQYAEVAIKRQLTRQGESSYYINNQPVRRRDITDLFLGTGVGARGYAVIEQGMISRIIEARPEELRAYIEEAAGVSKYKERRRETENRLKDTREHLQRLADLQSELDRQVEKLQRQAKTAERYRHLKAELAAHQDLLDYVQWQQALADADAATLRHREQQTRQDDIHAQIDSVDDSVRQGQETEQAQQQTVHELTNRRALLREQWARLEEQIRHRQSLQQRFEREKTQAHIQLQRLQQEQQQLATEAETLTGQTEEAQLRLEEWALQAAEHEAALPDLEQRAHDTALARQNQQDEYSRLQRERALKQQQHQHAVHSLQQLQARQQRLQEELGALNLPEDEAVAAAQAEADEHEAQVAEREQALAECEAQLEHWQAQSRRVEEALQQQRHRLVTLTAQQQAIEALLPADAAQDDIWPQDTPALWQHTDGDADWRHAVAVALGHRLQARAVAADFRPDAEQAAAWINRSPAAPAAPADSLLHRVHSSLPAFQAALAVWLAPLRCAPDLATALAQQHMLAAHEAWMTPEGHCVDAAGVVLYHSHSGDNLLQQRARLADLQAEQAALAAPLADTEAALARCHEAREHSAQQRIQLASALKQQQQQLQSALGRAAELLARTNQGQLRREHIARELQHIEQESALQQQIERQTAADGATLDGALAALEAQQQHLSGDNQQHQQALKQAQLAALEAKRQYGLAEMALQRLQQQQQHLAQQQQALLRQSEEWQERQSELALAYAEEEQDEEQQALLESLNAEIEAANEAYDAAQEALTQIHKQQQALYQRQQALKQQLPDIQAAAQTALLQQQEALLHAKRYHDNLTASGADLDSLAERAAADSPHGEALSRHIAELARGIQALGAVNLAALDELDEADERSRYYAAQAADVEAAMALLQEAIAQIDEETKSRFKATFDAVNDKVQTFFPTLFGGGEARLHMVGDDLLSAGVSIMARPPGKKNSTIHLLSGGEKALTAMSLVFALFSLNPAPFCLLDEVDAPLDDANTGRFCNLVKEMSAQTQFLYISHNRLTMEMAEQLVGVTMQEKGVSRIVAVDIQQALDMAEAQ
ncbi:chromosome segregation protein [Neisseria sp. HSC-16F19]|nr:chromosome segregation protein SMC [Neisseria sp. HSC-16F19]MCP2041844.1 chromosome segregation protein [Neisseria sp. HSC-16F19]